MSPDKRGARAGKVLIAGHFRPALQTRLKVLAARERTTVERLLGEAIELLFARRLSVLKSRAGSKK